MTLQRITGHTAPLFAMLAGAILLIVGLCGCRGASPGEDERQVTLFCGAGIRPAMEEIIEVFHRRTDVRVRTHYGASNLLLGQLKIAPDTADLFLPGDVFYVEEAQAEGLVTRTVPVAWFVPVILVRQGNPQDIRAVQDLAKPGLRLAVGDDRSAAIGRIMPMILEKHGLSPDALAQNAVFTAATAHELGNAVSMGHVDATIVWEAVARLFDWSEVVEIPPARNVAPPLAVGLLAHSSARAAAEEFMDFLSSPAAQTIFEDHHYALAPPAELTEDTGDALAP